MRFPYRTGSYAETLNETDFYHLVLSTSLLKFRCDKEIAPTGLEKSFGLCYIGGIYVLFADMLIFLHTIVRFGDIEMYYNVIGVKSQLLISLLLPLQLLL